MKKTKRGLALLLVLALVATLVAAASRNWSGADLGDLSQYYETGSVGAKEAKPGYISTVAGDAGGTSYGVYMFASKSDTPYTFAKWLAAFPEGTVYKAMGDTLVDAYEKNAEGRIVPGYGSNFNAKWTMLAETYHDEFYAAQKEFWQEEYYEKLLANVKAQFPGFDIKNYGIALRNVFWSRSVQHGVSGATTVITKAFNALGGFKNQSEEALIAAIYAECSKLDDTTASNRMTDAVAYKYGVGGRSMAYYSGNSGDVQISVYRRLHVNEPADAVVMLYQNQNYALPNGAYQILERANQNHVLSGATIATSNGGDSAQQFRLVNFANGCVTLSNGGKCLADNNGAVVMANAAASNSQMWKIVQAEAGGTLLQNQATGRYLAISGNALATVSEAASATAWQCSPLDTVYASCLTYPGCEEGRTNKLVAGNSSYPVRGVLTCAKTISKVTVAAKTASGAAAFSASRDVNANWFDLWQLDGACTFSKLSAGDYTISITAVVDGKTIEVGSSKFSVSPNSGAVVDDETYTVTFDANGGSCATKTKTYKLGDVYGNLPVATKEGYEFVGWFLDDGTEATATTPVAAKNHTLTAKYGDLHKVTFLNADGSTLKTLKLAKGELIKAPTNPVKAPDATYSYSFSHWEDAKGNRFIGGFTFMGNEDITYTPVFTKTEIPSGGTPTTPVDGGYQTGIIPGTEVSALTSKGYTVYNGTTKVTSGNLATGMTAVIGKTQVTIVVTGDANGDGKLTITDVVKLQSHVVGKNLLSGAFAKAADINGDNSITITDVVQAAQVVVGKRSLS